MSGGQFDYKQYALDDIADGIDEIIKNNFKKDEYGYCTEYSMLTISQMEETIKKLRELARDVHKIDYMVSDDISEHDLNVYFTDKIRL